MVGFLFVCLETKDILFQVNEKGYDYYIEATFLEAQENVTPVKQEIILESGSTLPKPELVSKGETVNRKKNSGVF